MPIYEAMKERTRRLNNSLPSNNNNDSFSFADNALHGMVAGSMAAFITTPIDVIKTNIMTERGGEQIRTIRQAARLVYAKSGVRGFFKGGVIRLSMMAFMSVIFFSAYEFGTKVIDI